MPSWRCLRLRHVSALPKAKLPLTSGWPLPDSLEIVSTRSTPLWDSLWVGYQVLGFDAATGGDEVFRDLVLARIIEPTSKADSLWVFAEAGIQPVDYRTVTRRLMIFAKPEFRQALSIGCAAHAQLYPRLLVLYDVSALYFETDAGDGFQEPGFSKERRLESQITLGLITDASGFPLVVEAFEGNKAETATMLPVINAFKAAHNLVVAGAGMTGLGARCAELLIRSPKPRRLLTGKLRSDATDSSSSPALLLERQPRVRGQSPRPGWFEGLHHQLPRTDTGVRDRGLPPALAHREEFPDVQHDLQVRPVYHHKRESIDAHLSIVFASLAVSHYIETQTGWSIKNSCEQTVQIKADRQLLTAVDPLPEDLRHAITKINDGHAH